MSLQRLTFWQTWVFLVVEGAGGRRSFEVADLLGFFVVVKLGPHKAASAQVQCRPCLLKKIEIGMWLLWLCCTPRCNFAAFSADKPKAHIQGLNSTASYCIGGRPSSLKSNNYKTFWLCSSFST